MWLTKLFALFICLGTTACALAQPEHRSICPTRPATTLKSVEVYDGPMADMAILMPDEAKTAQGFWKLAYVYEAGRTVNIRCQYADKTNFDVNLPNKIQQCNYHIDKTKNLELDCQ